MANRYTRRCSTSQIHREMQSKITLKYHLTLFRKTIIQKSINNKCWGCGEKGTFIHCWCECKLVQSLWKMIRTCLKKLKIELPYDWANSFGEYIKRSWKLEKMHVPPMFIAIFIIAKIWKQKNPSTDEWMKTMSHTHTHTHTRHFYSAIKKKKRFCHLQQHK